MPAIYLTFLPSPPPPILVNPLAVECIPMRETASSVPSALYLLGFLRSECLQGKKLLFTALYALVSKAPIHTCLKKLK